MRYAIRILVFLFAVIGAAVLADQVFGLNLGVQHLLGSIARKSPVKNLAPGGEASVHPQEAPAAEPPTADFVRIDGKLFPYNPKNAYVVNGVPTYYDPGRKKKAAEDKKDAPAPGQASRVVERMAEQAPLAVYTPQGMKATIEGAKDAVRQMEEKNKALKALEKEIDGAN